MEILRVAFRLVHRRGVIIAIITRLTNAIPDLSYLYRAIYNTSAARCHVRSCYALRDPDPCVICGYSALKITTRIKNGGW